MVNISNLRHIIIDLFEENIIRGKGLLCLSLMKGQLALPQITSVYTALISVINVKIPEIGDLLCRRVISQFQKAFRQRNKILMISLTIFIAHLVNYEVLSTLIALELLYILIHKPTNDSIEVAKEFMINVGAKLYSEDSRMFQMIETKFREILQKGNIDMRVQYSLEALFRQFKSRFKENPPIIKELNIIPEEDIICHNDLNIREKHDQEKNLNIFHYDPNWDKHENEYSLIRNEILGSPEEKATINDSSRDDLESKQIETEESSKSNENITKNEQKEEINILDLTNANTLNKRRQIYLITRASISFEEMAHKILKILPNEEEACAHMIVETCAHEKAYNKTFGLLGERLSKLNSIYQNIFDSLFAKQYDICHRFTTNHILNISTFFSHLLYTDSIDWTVLEYINMNERETNASKRIFVKQMFQELSSWMGKELKERLESSLYGNSFNGLFPIKNPKDCRFSINFFTHIGLGGLTVRMRQELRQMKKIIMKQRRDLLSDTENSINCFVSN